MAFSERYPANKVPLPQTWLQAFALLRKQIKSMASKQKKVIFWMRLLGLKHQNQGFWQL